MAQDKIIIKGAREHNLKNISLEIPRDKFVVITGLSGSGKSSLAFDTIYAEGQRRYVESLSAYARQFLGQMEKPDVEQIQGLSPAIAIQQKGISHNPRSTVGTLTEIYDYMRLLFARIGHPHCPRCGKEIKPQTSQEIIEKVIEFPSNSSLEILSPLIRGRKGEFKELFERVRKQGFARVRVDGNVFSLDEEIKLNKRKKHNIEIVVDRLVIRPEDRKRLGDSIETALKLGEGLVIIKIKSKEIVFSEHHACPDCGISIGEVTPRAFSFNSPYGACPSCTGLGMKSEVSIDLIVPDKSLSLNEGAIEPWSNPVTTRTHRWKGSWRGWYYEMLKFVSRHYKFSMDTPFEKLSKKHQDAILYGSGEVFFRPGAVYEGVIPRTERIYRDTESEYVREEIFNRYMHTTICPECKGDRLKKELLSVKVGGLSIAEVSAMSIKQAVVFFDGLKLTDKERTIIKQVLKEIKDRLSFLISVGLDYITINRAASSLAGGESQRINLATQIGSSLTGVTYILDEPTIGLHSRDTGKLVNSLIALKNLGNTLLVVEHDAFTIKAADYIIDLGPGAGAFGGEIVAAGTVSEVMNNKKSLTGRYLKGDLAIPIPDKRRPMNPEKAIEITGAAQFNLKNIDVIIPLGLFVCVTGVSGSGKSTLIQEILFKAIAQKLYHSKDEPGKFIRIKGLEHLDKIIDIDQSPIGRTPRSNPATYIDMFTMVRQLFSQLPDSKLRGYDPGRFSFNVKGGRCEACEGDGLIKIEMQFLAPVYVTCEVCKGRRYNNETLDIRYKGKNIAEVLDMSVTEACEFFKNIPKIKEKLDTLYDVGLGYIKLGQPATTLSGGEAQRIKLSKELSRRSTGRTLYILDEPTTGLHFADVEKLLVILHRLVDTGNTVLIIEHNLDVIKTADWIVDLGPDGGDLGGELVEYGPPEKIVRNKKSYTGSYLLEYLK